jgi:hypothetical protein
MTEMHAGLKSGTNEEKKILQLCSTFSFSKYFSRDLIQFYKRNIKMNLIRFRFSSKIMRRLKPIMVPVHCKNSNKTFSLFPVPCL